MPGQFPNAKTPHKDAPNNWNAVVTGMARDEPTNSNALNVMICPNPHPAPDNKANSKFVPVGKPLDVTTANIIAKINVPTVAPII